MSAQQSNGVIDVILNRSWDMGLNFIDQGKFESREELEDLFDGVYPWDVDDDEKSELIQELLDKGYIEPSPDADEVDCLQIVDDHLYAHYRDIELMGLCNCLIYDKGQDTYLLGFMAFDMGAITGAIDLATGTVGYYNSNNDTYTPVGHLRDEDVDTLNEVVEEDWTIDYTCTVNRASEDKSEPEQVA